MVGGVLSLVLYDLSDAVEEEGPSLRVIYRDYKSALLYRMALYIN